MADDLPDAPWAKQEELPDAPWAQRQATFDSGNPRAGIGSAVAEVGPEAAQADIGQKFIEAYKEGLGDEPYGVSQEDYEKIHNLGLPRLAEQALYGAASLTGFVARQPAAIYHAAQETLSAMGAPVDIISIPDAFMGSPHFSGVPEIEGALAPVAKEFHDDVLLPAAIKATANDVAEAAAAPSVDEKGRIIIRPRTFADTVSDARNLDVIGLNTPENINLVELAKRDKETPAEYAIRVAPPQSLSSAVTPEQMRGALSPREPLADYEVRFKQWVSRIDAPDDVAAVVDKAAADGGFFPEARAGEVPVSHVAAVAEAAGVKVSDIDEVALSSRFDSDAKVNAVIQALRQTSDDFVAASKKAREEPNEINAAAALEAEVRHSHVVEYTLGLRADSSRSLSAWKGMLRETERARAAPKIAADEAEGKAPTGTGDVVNAAHELRANLENPTEGKPLGLQKLVDAAERLAADPGVGAEGKPRAPLPPDLAGLVDSAKDTLNKLRPAAKKGDAELEAFQKKLTDLSEGNGSVGDTADAARNLIEATKKEGTEAAEPKEPGDIPRGKLIGMAKKLIEAQDGAAAKGARVVSPEVTKLSEAARVASGLLKEGRVRSQLDGFRQALEDFKTTGNGADLEAKSRSLLDALGELKEKGEIEPKALVEIDKITAAAKRFVADSKQAAKDLLPPDLKSLLEDSKGAIAELKGAQKTELEKTVAAAERQVASALKQKTARKPAETLPPEWQALVDKADLVTKRFGGIAKGEEAALILARAGRTAAEQAEIARSIEGLSPTQVANVLKRLRDNPGLGWQFWMIQQGLISGLLTHTKYAVINSAQTIFDRVIAPEFAAIVGKLRGDKVSLLAPIHAGTELIRNVPDALAGFKQAFKTGQRIPTAGEMRLAARGEKNPEAAGAQPTSFGSSQGPNWGTFKPEGIVGRILQTTPEGLAKAARILGVPGRSANAIHMFFHVLNERASAGMRAFETTVLEGKRPGTQDFWQRYGEHLDNPTDAALKANVEDGYTGTYMEKLGEQTEHFAKLVRDTPAKWLIFFTHIPMNIIRRGIEYSPLAAFNMLHESRMGSALKGELGHEAQNLAVMKASIGTAIGGYFVSKTLSGQMTGDYPVLPAERKRWQAEGIQPNSILANGQWMSLMGFGPLAMTARVAANFAGVIQHYDPKDDDAKMKAAFALVLGTGSALGGDAGLSAVKGLIDVMENPAEAARYAAYQMATFVQPVSFISQMASFDDPFMREANSLINGIKYRTPGLRETLEPKRNPVTGEPVQNPGYHSLFRAGQAANTLPPPIKRAFENAQYFPGQPERTIGGIRLNDKEYSKYQATAGPYVTELINRAINSPVFATMTPTAQKTALQDAVSAGRAHARFALQIDKGDLLRRGVEAAAGQ